MLYIYIYAHNSKHTTLYLFVCACVNARRGCCIDRYAAIYTHTHFVPTIFGWLPLPKVSRILGIFNKHKCGSLSKRMKHTKESKEKTKYSKNKPEENFVLYHFLRINFQFFMNFSILFLYFFLSK